MTPLLVISLTIVCVVVALMIATVVVVAVFTSVSTQRVRRGDRYTNHTRERTLEVDLSRYQPYYVRAKYRRALVELLSHVTRALDGHGVEYWAVAGTLLGAERHEGQIPWDDDADLGLRRAEFLRVKTIDWSPYGLELHDNNRNPKFCAAGTHFPFVDLFPIEARQGLLQYCMPLTRDQQPTFGVHDEWPKEAFPPERIFPLRRVPFEHFSLPAPKDGRQLLLESMGDDCLTHADTSNWWRRHIPWVFDSHAFSA